MLGVFEPTVPFVRANGLSKIMFWYILSITLATEVITYEKITSGPQGNFPLKSPHITTRNKKNLFFLHLAGQPGTIIVKITTEGGACLGETDFTYKNPKKKLIHQGLSNKRKLDELYAVVNELEKKIKQIQQGDNDEENQTSSFQQGNCREQT